ALGGSPQSAVAANSVVALNPSGSVVATVPVGARPVALTSGRGTLWVANLDDKSVTRVDVPSRKAVRTISVAAAPTGLAADNKGVWVSVGRALSRIDPTFNQVTSTRHVGGPIIVGVASAPQPALSAFGSIWVADADGYVVRVDRDSGRPTGTID